MQLNMNKKKTQQSKPVKTAKRPVREPSKTLVRPKRKLVKAHTPLQSWLRQKPVRISCYLLALLIAIVAVWQILLTVIRDQPKFCYVRSGELVCLSDPGRAFHARIIYNLPHPDGYELTSLIPSPDQQHYIAMATSDQTGLGDFPPHVWLLDHKLQVVRSLNVDNDFTYGSEGRVFAVWSLDSSHVLLKASSGSDALYDYDLAAGKLSLTTPLDSNACAGSFAGYYGFDDQDRIVLTCGDQYTTLVTINPADSKSKTLSTVTGKNAFAGSFVATIEGPIVYHLGNTLYAFDPSTGVTHKLAAKADFDYFKYDPVNDELYLIKKIQNTEGYTLGVKSVAYISVINLFAGLQPTTVTLNSPIHAEDTPYVTPVSATQIVLSGLNGSELVNLKTGNNTALSPAPSEPVPSDVGTNLEGITGMLHDTNGFKWSPLHQKFTVADQIRGLNKAPKQFQQFIEKQFASQELTCIQNPGRYGSQLDMRILGVKGKRAAVIVSCQVTGYWGRAGTTHLYVKVDAGWHELTPNPALNVFGVWPSCEPLQAADFPKSLVPKCINAADVEQANTVE